MSVMSVADTMPGAQNTKPMDPPEMETYSLTTLDWVQVSPFLTFQLECCSPLLVHSVLSA